jgi:hypothetical protein
MSKQKSISKKANQYEKKVEVIPEASFRDLISVAIKPKETKKKA